jgi:transposase InsO family protein
MKDIANKKKHSRFLPISECSIKDRLPYYQGLLYIPDDAAIKLEVLHANHDVPSAGHHGRARTLELLSRNYYWPQMRKYVARYVDHCDTCSHIKPVRHVPYGLLKPLTLPAKPWSSLSMDHVTGLPESKGSNAIRVVVDRLIKMAHYIPTRDTADAAELACLFLQHVWKSHGLPKDIVSDRGTTFTSQFWKALCNQLDIKPRYSTAFHPQTDGETEQVNAIMEQYLRGYVNYQQDNWSEFLPLALFAHNNATMEPLGVSQFFTNYGYNPQTDILPAEERYESMPMEVVDFTNSISTLQAALRSEILYAQAAATDSANAARLLESCLEVGDMVWLSRKHIRTTRLSDKLDHKRLGKFKILEHIGSHTYRLELPASMKSYPVFHVSLLEPARMQPLQDHLQLPPPPVIIE